jgi:hypothetical protein
MRPTFCGSVAPIVAGSAPEQMSRIDAFWVVAGMACHQVIASLAGRYLQRQSVSAKLSPVHYEHAIAAAKVAGPLPAFIVAPFDIMLVKIDDGIRHLASSDFLLTRYVDLIYFLAWMIF